MLLSVKKGHISSFFRFVDLKWCINKEPRAMTGSIPQSNQILASGRESAIFSQKADIFGYDLTT